VIALYRRFTSLDHSDRRLVLEAASLIALIWTGLRVLRFPTLRQVLDRYVRSSAAGNAFQSHATAIGQVGWAVTRVADRFPVSVTCLVQALAADAILRRRGLASELYIGVRVSRNSAVQFEAHAWVESEGEVAIGGIESLPDFTVLTQLTSQ
jgi:hypothetical protein